MVSTVHFSRILARWLTPFVLMACFGPLPFTNFPIHGTVGRHARRLELLAFGIGASLSEPNLLTPLYATTADICVIPGLRTFAVPPFVAQTLISDFFGMDRFASEAVIGESFSPSHLRTFARVGAFRGLSSSQRLIPIKHLNLRRDIKAQYLCCVVFWSELQGPSTRKIKEPLVFVFLPVSSAPSVFTQLSAQGLSARKRPCHLVRKFSLMALWHLPTPLAVP